MERRVFFGNFFHSLSFQRSESVLNGFIAIEDGKIVAVGEKSSYETWNHPNKKDFEEVQLTETQFFLPGFVDTHIHAPQVPNIGLGLDKPLMEWLNEYTFPLESQYKDKNFAKHVFNKVVRRTLNSGTTTASYFGTIHKDACKVLADEALAMGQRAFIGKVSMNQYSPETYVETFEESIKDNIEVIEYILSLKSDLLSFIITPRFAITCSMDLLKQLAVIADKYKLPIQSHISENLDEIKFTMELFPGHDNYAQVYDVAGLLTNKCIMAHAVHLTDDEVKLFAERGTSVAH
ncbi:CLUMA_CG002528, isoform A [Clunio marinus]|uniref:CLUMA_CG002528, isoform A n=1 Tax=Clunio marinus TaxID=568069 RepID=A0A1J1HLF9_9DIPT|nr:CLUMA_CG002528, isoform A [Clunio marinus]